MIDDERGLELTRFARASIARALGGPDSVRPSGEWFGRPAATFVTLYRSGALHGCIGSIEARRPLADDVAINAVAAALRDPRAMPLELRDVAGLTVEVSLLSPLEPIAFADEASALGALRRGVDGVVLRYADVQSTFLPEVWDKVSDQREFLAHLKAKAGLPETFWASGLALYRYTCRKWSSQPELDAG